MLKLKAIKPEGWQKVCERALTADIKSKCAIMRAFVHHANEESVTIDVPNDCCMFQFFLLVFIGYIFNTLKLILLIKIRFMQT